MEAIKKYTKIIKHNKTYLKLLIQLPSRTEKNLKTYIYIIGKHRHKKKQIRKNRKIEKKT